jgi:ATP/maltotriose-dependent transcriptional regulator MalT
VKLADDDPRRTSPPERRIIDRPRLLEQLEETKARTILLIAPAGYGKTTLARQWAQGRNVAWFSANLRSADIASLSRGLAESLSAFAPDLVARVDESLRAMQHPARELSVLSELFVSRLCRMDDCWLIIDDYQTLESSFNAEQFVEVIAHSKTIQLLIASRTRPRWASAREFIYGELIELRRNDLALDDTETARVLAGSTIGHQSGHDIVDRAHGWPAVIGLAAIAGAPGAPARENLSLTLYDFLAEESFNNAPPATQDALMRMAVLPSLDTVELTSLFGDETLAVAAEAARTGLLDLSRHSIDLRVEVHPLARAFLFEKLRQHQDVSLRVRNAIAHAIMQEAWDEAFGLIEAFKFPGELDRLITASFAPLLAQGRVETLERFMRYAVSERRGTSALIDLIDAEISFRDGSLDQAQALAVSAAEELPVAHPLRAHGYNLAGKAALARFSPTESYALHSLALSSNQSTHDQRDAVWGQCLALIYLEDAASIDAAHRLSRIGGASPEDRVRAATAELLVSRLGKGFRNVEPALAAKRMIRDVRDPRARTSYGNVCSYVLALQGRYNEADAVVNVALRDADTYRLAFATPHLHWTKALASLGRRRFSEANAHLRSVEATEVIDASNTHLQLNTRALRARILLAQHRHAEAVAITADAWDSVPTRAMYGEYLATRALALAATNRVSAALGLLDEVRDLTSAVEVQTLAATAEAITAVGTPRGAAAATKAFNIAMSLDTWDALVCGVRAVPELLESLMSENTSHRHLITMLGRSRDESLLRRSGLTTERIYGRGGVLSRRECEIIELVGQGLTNREMSHTLFISEATVKVHVRHILEKLGARTRAQAVALYAAIADEAPSDSSDTGSASA